VRRLLLLSVICLFASSSFAQTTGVPPFRPVDAGQFDAVNIGNLNTNFAIPIVSTPSRGKSFNLSLVYDSLTWQKNVTAWTPVTDRVGNPIWGWKTTAPLCQSIRRRPTLRSASRMLSRGQPISHSPARIQTSPLATTTSSIASTRIKAVGLLQTPRDLTLSIPPILNLGTATPTFSTIRSL
jgi:hypothetical protein